MIRKLLTTNLISLLMMTCVLNAAAVGRDTALEKKLASLGYRITFRNNPVPTDWQKNEFDLQSQRIYAVKSLKPVRGERNLYYRFSVAVETYKNESDAEKRMAFITKTPPGVDSKMQPEYVLREGFRRGRLVYTVSTDVYKFYLDGDLKRLREKLEKEIKN